jgi:DNA repair photolyase
MNITELHAKSLIRRHRKIDSWFISKYGMNLYRGCMHDCVYCDGRSEKYQVHENFGNDVTVKINAIELLKKEMNLKRRQKFYQNGFIMIGGGVGDSYQPIEKEYELTKKTLAFLEPLLLPIHILTKSTLVERDIDLLKRINEKSKALISFSFSSTNDEISKIFEPGVPPPSDRLKTIKKLKHNGFSCGMYLLPVIPFITDTKKIMKKTIKDAYQAGVDYIIFGGMTLKSGRQKEYFYDIIDKYYPDLLPSYEMIYTDDKWGNAAKEYYQSIDRTFQTIMKQYSIPKRIPPVLFKDSVSENDLVVIILDQLHYLVSLQGKKSPYGFAAYNISKLDQNLSSMKNKLQSIKGVGRVTERIILEILETGTSTYYDNLLIQ